MYSRNADLHTFPASIGKLIAALVVIDKMNMEDIITVKGNMVNPN
jgi:D-alanyl-D-alanine carboxypeptidase